MYEKACNDIDNLKNRKQEHICGYNANLEVFLPLPVDNQQSNFLRLHQYHSPNMEQTKTITIKFMFFKEEI